MDVFFYAFFFTAYEYLWLYKTDWPYLIILWPLIITAIIMGKLKAKHLLLITAILVISLIPLAHLTGGFTVIIAGAPIIVKFTFYLALLWAFFTHLVITIFWLFKLHDFHTHPAIWIVSICFLCAINPAFIWSAYGDASWASNYENKMGLIGAFAAHMIITGVRILILPAMIGLLISIFPQRYVKNILALFALLFWYFICLMWGPGISRAFFALFPQNHIISLG